MKKNEEYSGGLCDPNKATSCKKTICAYITKNENHCRHTTNPLWLKERKNDKSK